MVLGDRELARPPVLLARGGEDHLRVGVVGAERLEQRELRLPVDLEVRLRIGHRVDVGDLAGEVEDQVLVLDQAADRPGVADVRVLDVDPVGDLADVERVAPVLRDQRVDDRHLGAAVDERRRQVRSDEPEPAGDDRAPARERIRVHRLGSSIQATPARPAFSRRDVVGRLGELVEAALGPPPPRAHRAAPGPAAPELAGHHPRAEGDVREEEDAAVREAPQHVPPGLVVELGVDAVEEVEVGVERLLAAEVMKVDGGVGEVLTEALDRARRDVGEHELDVRHQSPQPGLDDPGADPVGRDLPRPRLADPVRERSRPARLPVARLDEARVFVGVTGKAEDPLPLDPQAVPVLRAEQVPAEQVPVGAEVVVMGQRYAQDGPRP